MRIIQEERLNHIYRISLYKANGYYNVRVTKIRPLPRGNFNSQGEYRGPLFGVAYNASEDLFEAVLMYSKLRQVWRHCYS